MINLGQGMVGDEGEGHGRNRFNSTSFSIAKSYGNDRDMFEI